jgi:nucleoside-diphosphate-sugar epimerase
VEAVRGADEAVSDERFLVTGALGCIGAWTVRSLVREGTPVVAFDRASDPRRLRLIMEPAELARVTVAGGDITELESVERVLDAERITHVIHLAALQVPFCKADPPLGARVNVVGTVNVLEAVRRRADRIGGLVYTSSIGMFDAADADPTTGRLAEAATAHPINHYGVYKLANEGNARVYWLDDRLPSVGIRPMVVYGPGRDQGLTSGPTKAILAAVLGRPFEINFGGQTLFQYAEDVGRTLVIAARSRLEGARVFNLGGSLTPVEAFVSAIEAALPAASGLVTIAGDPLPFPEQIDHDELEAQIGPVPVTPLEEAVAATVDLFRRRLATGALDPEANGLPQATAA